jgi:hypothetical protein
MATIEGLATDGKYFRLHDIVGTADEISRELRLASIHSDGRSNAADLADTRGQKIVLWTNHLVYVSISQPKIQDTPPRDPNDPGARA